ncbi:MAG TPA: ABC transporter permease, partial [Casimicrobiaceae bacterium]|nr:ABC transporter permease [Casimicrobiaceae bacterium]
MTKAIEAIGTLGGEVTRASLRTQLKRAERLAKLKYMLLIAPLALFLFVVFVWPLVSLLQRSVNNPEIAAALPST